MNIKDKLSNFSEAIMHEAEDERLNIIKEIEEKTKAACAEAEKKALKKADATFVKEKYKAEQVKNKAFINASTEAKKSLAALRDSLMDKLMLEVEQKLEKFTNSNEYEQYLIKQIQDSVHDYQNVEVLLMERDMRFVKGIQEKVQCEILKTDENFIGGFKMIVKDKNGLLDNSFRSKLEEARRKFNPLKITG